MSTDTPRPDTLNGEPVFILRAMDSTAPALVRMWAAQAEAVGCPTAEADQARALADRMECYAHEHYGGGRLPG